MMINQSEFRQRVLNLVGRLFAIWLCFGAVCACAQEMPNAKEILALVLEQRAKIQDLLVDVDAIYESNGGASKHVFRSVISADQEVFDHQFSGGRRFFMLGFKGFDVLEYEFREIPEKSEPSIQIRKDSSRYSDLVVPDLRFAGLFADDLLNGGRIRPVEYFNTMFAEPEIDSVEYDGSTCVVIRWQVASNIKRELWCIPSKNYAVVKSTHLYTGGDAEGIFTQENISVSQLTQLGQTGIYVPEKIRFQSYNNGNLESSQVAKISYKTQFASEDFDELKDFAFIEAGTRVDWPKGPFRTRSLVYDGENIVESTQDSAENSERSGFEGQQEKQK